MAVRVRAGALSGADVFAAQEPLLFGDPTLTFHECPPRLTAPCGCPSVQCCVQACFVGAAAWSNVGAKGNHIRSVASIESVEDYTLVIPQVRVRFAPTPNIHAPARKPKLNRPR